MKISENMYLKSLAILEKLLAGTDIAQLSEEARKELEYHSDIVEAYEEEHFSIEMPSLIDAIKLRMFEMDIKQKDLAKILNVPATRISEYLKGRRDITLEVARKLHQELDIDAEIILQ